MNAHGNDILEELDELEVHLTNEGRISLGKLRSLQDEFRLVEQEHMAEMRKLRAKYEIQYNMIYERRKQVLVQGDAEEGGTPGLPQFWVIAMKNSRMLGSAIELYDIPILSYLVDITYEWTDELQAGFTLNFTFKPNSYFEGTSISKTYVMVQLDEDEPLLSNTTVSPILWKQGKDPTQEVVTRRQRHKQTKEIRMITETITRESFFNFFKPLDVPTDDKLEKMDRYDVMELEAAIETDYEMGVFIRDKLIPYAVHWFTGEAIDEDDEADEDDEGDILNIDDDDNDDDDDDDDDDNNNDDNGGKHKAKFRKSNHKHLSTKTGEECKNQ
ncbi:nucleosome assembly protein, putative [Cryptosporidium muris RN66]|uniref:Nucleosome assembly protein, putative n=1 Tax=Cryptosporidium muris (strain RN66) TaxID=441375 RepID=B6AEJ5_CRYMR|nr:nucleosome assembly protein, putative [Cryptosporidium muris RN66]EEA06612.1 nucleosome assembly protein, putative [Cryptosporidium muris RN66]|eukprot:XP_002140961.1 nucleosome assembly protein [Cryptosporidium muris RN66]